MAELADALDSGSSRGNLVEVQVLLAAIFLYCYRPEHLIFHQYLLHFNVSLDLRNIPQEFREDFRELPHPTKSLNHE